MPKSLPNILTLFRILLVPVFVVLVLKGRMYPAAGVFFLASATDAVDGYLARRFDLKTPLGAIMDPVADKLLLTSAFFVLAYKGLVPVWLFAAVIFRDLVMIAGLALFKALGKTFAAVPTPLGKFTTVFQVCTVIYAIVLYKGLGAGVYWALISATAFVTLYSALDYSIRELKKQSLIR